MRWMKYCAEPGVLDVFAHGAVDFPSGNAAFRALTRLDYRLHSDITGLAHDLENFPHAVRKETCPQSPSR